MKKLVLVFVLGFGFVIPQVASAWSATGAVGQTATWTGRWEPAKSVTGIDGRNCEYSLHGQSIWIFTTGFNCPFTIQVR